MELNLIYIFLGGIISNIVIVSIALFKFYNYIIIKFADFEKALENRITKLEVKTERNETDLGNIFNKLRKFNEEKK